jgi:rhamnosyltransferase
VSVPVSVAIPVLDGGPELQRTLDAVRAQRLDRAVELVICDSGSTDGSLELARRHADTVIEIARAEFGHGRTRNLLMERCAGSHVAFLTQDAVPAGAQWLARLLSGFDLAADVGLVYGPYRPRPGASPMVARELTEWFASLSPGGEPRIDRVDPARSPGGRLSLLGAPGFFTDANGCVARAAWERVPFADVPYAEDQRLAVDMLRAGIAKVYVPEAAVVHSHEYSALDWMRRSFDEARGLADVYGWREPLDPRRALLTLYGNVGADWRWAGRAPVVLARSTVHHAARAAGTLLGGRADRLAPALVARLSLEGRSN